jgi:hypothetical protein
LFILGGSFVLLTGSALLALRWALLVSGGANVEKNWRFEIPAAAV